MIVFGLDIGQKRIGIAKSDELGMFAHGMGYIEKDENTEWIKKIDGYIAEYAPGKIVVGMPTNLDGTHGIAAENIQNTIDILKANITIDIVSWDERLTSKQAMRYMQNTNISGKKKKKKVDSLAAQIMLQDYLDYNKGSIL